MNDDLFSLMFELEDIEDVEEVGLVNMIDISVRGDETFHLANGLISHNSAVSACQDAFGRKEIGYYELKGKPLNAYSQSSQKFRANKELSELYTIINTEGGDLEKEGKFFELDFGDGVVIVNENDEVNIKGIWVNVSEILKELDGF